MTINGKMYTISELKCMAKLYEQYKDAANRGKGTVGTLNKKYPPSDYIITYADGSVVTQYLKPGDPLPHFFEREIHCIQQVVQLSKEKTIWETQIVEKDFDNLFKEVKRELRKSRQAYEIYKENFGDTLNYLKLF